MLAASAFDYMHELKQVGVSDQQSEVHARRLAKIIAEVKEEVEQNFRQEIQIDSLITKKDLDLAIEEVRKEIVVLRYDTLKFIVWTGIAVVIALGGMMASLAGMIAKGFHWF
ncbi:MAG: hypothetical protein KBD83_07995 [Gammaproteobacteria bacterium]|nr:hypothetical protein [Gammaproteobacteria bacterium]